MFNRILPILFISSCNDSLPVTIVFAKVISQTDNFFSLSSLVSDLGFWITACFLRIITPGNKQCRLSFNECHARQRLIAMIDCYDRLLQQ